MKKSLGRRKVCTVALLCMAFCLFILVYSVNNINAISDKTFREIKPQLGAVGFEDLKIISTAECHRGKSPRYLGQNRCTGNVVGGTITITAESKANYLSNTQKLEKKLRDESWSNILPNTIANVVNDMNTRNYDLQTNISKKVMRTTCVIIFYPESSTNELTVEFGCYQERNFWIF